MRRQLVELKQKRLQAEEDYRRAKVIADQHSSTLETRRRVVMEESARTAADLERMMRQDDEERAALVERAQRKAWEELRAKDDAAGDEQHDVDALIDEIDAAEDAAERKDGDDKKPL